MVETYTHDFEGDIVAVAVAGEVIEATANHPFWVAEGDGLDGRDRPEHVPETPPDARTLGRWVDAGSLRVGDVLLLRPDRRASVTRLTVRQARQTVYNFQVEGVHTYAVGTAQVLVHNKPAANSLLAGESAPLQPGRMHVVPGRTQIGQEGYRDFVVPGRSVEDIFAARMMDGSRTLEIAWTESLGRGTLAGRIARAQELAGGPGSITRITGQASAEFRDAIRAGRFSLSEAEQALGSRVGGTWRVELVPRANSVPPTWDVVATRIGN